MRSILPLVVLLVIVLGLVAIVNAITKPPPPVTQPIAFNHALHIEEAAMECTECHTDAPNRVYAGIPGWEFCEDCHDPSDADEGELMKLAPFLENEEQIPWKRVALVPPDVYFSHRRHVTAGGIECERCHPGQSTLESPPSHASLAMSMDDCMECHEESAVSTDCVACHR